MAETMQSTEALREYSKKVKESHAPVEDGDLEEDYEVRINNTLQSLQTQIKQHESALEKVHSPQSPYGGFLLTLEK